MQRNKPRLFEITGRSSALHRLMSGMGNAAQAVQFGISRLDNNVHVIVQAKESPTIKGFHFAEIDTRYTKPGYTEVTFTKAVDGLKVVAVDSIDAKPILNAGLDAIFDATYVDRAILGDETGNNTAIYLGSERAERVLLAKVDGMGEWRQITDKSNVDFAVTDNAIGFCRIGESEVMAVPVDQLTQGLKNNKMIRWSQMADLPQPLAYFGRGKGSKLPVNLQGEHGIDYAEAKFLADGDTLKLTLMDKNTVRSSPAKAYDDVVIGLTGVYGDTDTLAFRGNGMPDFRAKSAVPAPLWQLAARTSGMNQQTAAQ